MPLMWTALCVAVAAAASDRISDEQAFEETVIQSGEVWAVLFTSASKGEDAAPAEKLVERLAMKASDIHFGVADVDDVKSFASGASLHRTARMSN